MAEKGSLAHSGPKVNSLYESYGPKHGCAGSKKNPINFLIFKIERDKETLSQSILINLFLSLLILLFLYLPIPHLYSSIFFYLLFNPDSCLSLSIPFSLS